jgi:hypothetical protein
MAVAASSTAKTFAAEKFQVITSSWAGGRQIDWPSF